VKDARLFVRLRCEAQVVLHFAKSLGELLLGVIVIHRVGNDHVIAVLPVDRRRHRNLAESCRESRTRMISSTLRPVDAG